jgi:hypothetical protein
MKRRELPESFDEQIEQIGEALENQGVSLPGPLEAQPPDLAYECFHAGALNPAKNVGEAICVGAMLLSLAADGF